MGQKSNVLLHKFATIKIFIMTQLRMLRSYAHLLISKYCINTRVFYTGSISRLINTTEQISLLQISIIYTVTNSDGKSLLF